MNDMNELNKHKLWTANELCEYLRVSRPTVQRWVKQGKIPCRRAGATLRFDRDDIMEWMKKGNK